MKSILRHKKILKLIQGQRMTRNEATKYEDKKVQKQYHSEETSSTSIQWQRSGLKLIIYKMRKKCVDCSVAISKLRRKKVKKIDMNKIFT